jgi:serine/threonine protein kinase
MEYMMGGDFLGLLLREDILDENVAKWYLAEMILCIEEAHKMNWIHRDVKPDNFLITSSGHLRISDFGLAFDGHWAHNQTYYNEQRYSLLRDLGLHVQGDAQDMEEERNRQDARKNTGHVYGNESTRNCYQTRQETTNGPIIDWLNREQRRQFAKSVVGTSQYMAPEVIRGENYDGRCDWWSIGIILYEVRRFRRRDVSLTCPVPVWMYTVFLRKQTGDQGADTRTWNHMGSWTKVNPSRITDDGCDSHPISVTLVRILIAYLLCQSHAMPSI